MAQLTSHIVQIFLSHLIVQRPESLGYCQIIGPDVCLSAPKNDSETLTSLSMGVLWVPNVALRSPDEGGTLFESNFVKVPGNTAKQTWTLPNAPGVVALQADVQGLSPKHRSVK